MVLDSSEDSIMGKIIMAGSTKPWLLTGKSQDGFPIKNVGNDRVGGRLIVVRPVVDSLEQCRAPFEC